MNKLLLLFLLFTYSTESVSAQITGFEKEIPTFFECSKGSTLALSDKLYKEGQKSLEWKYLPNSILTVKLEKSFSLTENTEKQYGIMLWIYNEYPQQDSVRFEFLSPSGHVSYRFAFRLAAAGWRACWIGFSYMKGDKKQKEVSGFQIIAPEHKGRIFLDRLTFPVKQMNVRTTPDMQMPYNNSLASQSLAHWCRVWQWEQLEYDPDIIASITQADIQGLHVVEQKLTQYLTVDHSMKKDDIKRANQIYAKAQIRRSNIGFIGAPLVAHDDNLKRKSGELSLNDLETMLSGFAYDMYYNHSTSSEEKYITVWRYAISQGFAFGSGMGTNHHYGYQTRKIFTSAWLVRDKIRKSSYHNEILSALLFWSSLQETRQPCKVERDGLVDCWNTLLMSRTVSALMVPDQKKRAIALKGLSRWLSTSLRYTPGTIGGIKIDGTTFHHGGFYPAYTAGALGMVGQFINLTNGTSYGVTLSGRKALCSALIAMRNYCNTYEWGIGISGRHPFSGSMKKDDVDAFAYLALSGDLSGRCMSFDHRLAADYLRLSRKNSALVAYFRRAGIAPARSPEGFFVYNYGSTGIFRRSDWMVTLKGYNTDVWGAEIYAHDNRYGRYQSYGSVQIMGGKSRMKSGYDENGWDWNRLPGTTAIHLPFELLDSPLRGTTMLKSKETFSGSCSLEGKNGMFSMKLSEGNLKYFTPDFVARKSVFCFGNRMICIGTGISNSNEDYPTETTLFQTAFIPGRSSLLVEGKKENKIGYSKEINCNGKTPLCLSDGYGNYYFVRYGLVKAQIAEQKSRHDKTRTITHGTFASAWLDHGIAPKNQHYEYVVWVQPTAEMMRQEASPLNTYEVLCNDNRAHAVYDYPTGITAYATFEAFSPSCDKFFLHLPAQTMIMYRNEGHNKIMSVCDPNLNLPEKTYTTILHSVPIIKEIRLKGRWKLSGHDNRVQLAADGTNTILTVICQQGQPAEFTLLPGCDD